MPIKRNSQKLPGVALKKIALDLQTGTLVLDLEREGNLTLASQCNVYVALPVNFAAGEVNKTLSVASAGDAAFSAQEAFGIYLADAENAAFNYTATESIVAIPTIITVVSVSGATVNEGGEAVHTVTLSGTTTLPTILAFSVVPITASAIDYSMPPTFTNGVLYNAEAGIINVPVGISAFSVNLATVDDSEDEINETYTIAVGGVGALGTIIDNDTVAPTPATVTSVSSQSVTEGGTLIYGVVLSGLTATQTTYSFVLSGNATSAVDFTASPTFTNGVTLGTNQITVPAGVSSFAVNFATINDALEEASETLILTIGGQSGTGTILDNDSAIPANATLLAANDGSGGSYPSSQRAFNDLMKGAVVSYDVNQSANGYPFNLPVGTSIGYTLITDLKSYLKPGNYKVVADKPIGLAVSGPAGITNIVNGDGTATFTVAVSPSGVYTYDTGYFVALTVTGRAGAQGEVIIKFYHMDDEAYIQAGRVATADWINHHKHLKLIRNMDTIATNNNAVQTIDRLPTEASRHWQNNAAVNSSHFPPFSVLAKRVIELHHETGKIYDFWLNLPTGNYYAVSVADVATDSFPLDGDAGVNARLVANNFTQGQSLLIETYSTGLPAPLNAGIYYADISNGLLRLSATSNGAVINITGAGGIQLTTMRDPAPLYNHICTELYGVAHTVGGITYNFRDVIDGFYCEPVNEPWNTNNNFKPYRVLISYGSYLATGAIGDLVEGLKIFSLKAWKAASDAGFANVKRVINCQIGALGSTTLPMLNKVDSTGIIASGAQIRTLNPVLAIAPYFNFDDDAVPVDDANLNYSLSKSTWLTNGALAETDEKWLARVKQGINRKSLLVKKFKQAVATYQAGLEITTYEAGTHDDVIPDYGLRAGNYALSQRIMSFLRTSAMAPIVHQYYYDNVFVANALPIYNQYTAGGNIYTSFETRMTSATSHPLTAGAKTFVVSNPTTTISAGNVLEVISRANPENAMLGTVTSYNSGTNTLVINITEVIGSGTFADWSFGNNRSEFWGMTDSFSKPDTPLITWWKTLVPYGLDTGFIAGIATPADTAEGSNMTFVVTLTQAFTAAKRGLFSISGQVTSIDIGSISATNGVVLNGEMLTIPAGVTTFNVVVPTVNDADFEYNETVILTIAGVSATGIVLFNDGGTANPDYLFIDDVINKTYPAVSPVKVSDTEEYVTWPTNANWYYDIRLHLAQTSKAGTPIFWPSLAAGEVIRFKFETHTSIETVSTHYNYQLVVTRTSDGNSSVLPATQTRVQGTGAYAGITTLEYTNDRGETISAATHSVILRVHKAAATAVYTQYLRNFYRA